jgi:hypothetical protein
MTETLGKYTDCRVVVVVQEATATGHERAMFLLLWRWNDRRTTLSFRERKKAIGFTFSSFLLLFVFYFD